MTVGDQPTITPTAATPVAVAAAARGALDAAAALPVDIAAAAKVLPKLHALALLWNHIYMCVCIFCVGNFVCVFGGELVGPPSTCDRVQVFSAAAHWLRFK